MKNICCLLLIFLLTACPQPQNNEVDFSEYFRGINGTAVFYNPQNQKYLIHNLQLSEQRSSPCSTFKIMSSFIALSENILSPETPPINWNGRTYHHACWNKNMTMPEAFKTSCVWYFRQLIDRIGPEKMQRYLNRYRYGNRDASDWPGKLNHDTDVKELKGFWIESSLQISPAEQVRVLSEIFAADTPAARELKNIMQITGGEIKIYGKTGLGTDGPLVKDAWFVGFYEYRGQTVFFAVRLNDQSRPEIKDYASSASRIARQIAIEIINQERPLLIQK